MKRGTVKHTSYKVKRASVTSAEELALCMKLCMEVDAGDLETGENWRDANGRIYQIRQSGKTVEITVCAYKTKTLIVSWVASRRTIT